MGRKAKELPKVSRVPVVAVWKRDEEGESVEMGRMVHQFRKKQKGRDLRSCKPTSTFHSCHLKKKSILAPPSFHPISLRVDDRGGPYSGHVM